MKNLEARHVPSIPAYLPQPTEPQTTFKFEEENQGVYGIRFFFKNTMELPDLTSR
jgi:hypothetical protein